MSCKEKFKFPLCITLPSNCIFDVLSLLSIWHFVRQCPYKLHAVSSSLLTFWKQAQSQTHRGTDTPCRPARHVFWVGCWLQKSLVLQPLLSSALTFKGQHSHSRLPAKRLLSQPFTPAQVSLELFSCDYILLSLTSNYFSRPNFAWTVCRLGA